MSGTATAITGNPSPNTSRANVGLIIFYSYDSNKNPTINGLSSCVLISSNKVLTAAHSIVSSNFIVTFEDSPIIVNNNGEFSLDLLKQKYSGKAYANPQYSIDIEGKNGLKFVTTHDVAVLVLTENVPSTVVQTFAELPEPGKNDALGAKDVLELVGYGVQDHLSPRNVGLQQTWTGTLARHGVTSKPISGNFAWSNEFLRCSANVGQGKGGIAFGDSGGPVFQEGTNVVLALNTYVTNDNCVGETYHTRLDLPGILDWILGVN